MTILLLVLSIISIIATWRLISFGVQTVTRITIATETTAIAMQMLLDGMLPETKDRAIKTRMEREIKNMVIQKAKQKAANRHSLIVLGVIIAIVAIIVLGSQLIIP